MPSTLIASTVMRDCTAHLPTVLVRISGGTSEIPSACFLDASSLHPGKPPRSPIENEGRRRGGLGDDAKHTPRLTRPNRSREAQTSGRGGTLELRKRVRRGRLRRICSGSDAQKSPAEGAAGLSCRDDADELKLHQQVRLQHHVMTIAGDWKLLR